MRVTISDDGVNLEPGWKPGVGLASIRERTAELGGVCEIRHDRAGGRVSVTLPVVRSDAPWSCDERPLPTGVEERS